jgi:DNA-binding transcriptional LysR family regulator
MRKAMIPNLDVDLLKTFLAIADNGSFTKAADEVHKTQSAVSMQMKRLEELVGTPLFARDGRMSRFTQDGERLVDYARRIVAINDEAIYAFAKPDLTGTIKFGTPDDYAERFLPEILARFARTHPMVTVDVECLGSGELFERCKRGEMDLSLVTHGCDILTSTRHHAHMAEILPLAVSHAGCGWRSMVLRALDAQQRKFRVAYSTPNSNAVNAAVLQGLAVGAIPELCLRPGMRVLTEKDGFPSLGTFDIGLVRKPGKANKAIEALARHVTDSLSTLQGQLIAAE